MGDNRQRTTKSKGDAYVLDPYGLLGLKAGESDSTKIRQAIYQTRRRLEEDAWYSSGADSRKLLLDLEQAEKILTDASLKRAFDQKLNAGRSEPEPDLEPDVEAESAETEADDEPTPGLLRRTLGELSPVDRGKLLIACAGIIVTAILVIRPFLVGPPKFPKPLTAPPVVTGADLTSPRMAKAPKEPSVPGLEIGVPVRVPGLEKIEKASSPTLSADLKTMVFVAKGERGGDDELYITTRDDIRRPFRKPEALTVCNTSADEQAPSLSRDGNELFFVRDKLPFVTTRNKTGEPFKDPVRVPVPGVEPGEGDGMDSIQIFADDTSVALRVFRRTTESRQNQRYVVGGRSARSSPLERADELTLWRPWAFNAFSADILRNYAATSEGVMLASRRGRTNKFGMPGLIQTLMPDKTGAIDGPFWVAPKEDVLYYSSVGPEPADPKKRNTKAQAPDKSTNPAAPRHLWMIRFR